MQGKVVCCVVLLIGVILGSGYFNIDRETQLFRDETGRYRIFHGVNIVYKIPPYHPETSSFDPETSLTTEDIELLSKWGFNMVRLGVMWPGAEPSPNQYNETYLQVMSNIVDQLISHGIYPLIDPHQDLLSPYFCGEGLPDWAITTRNESWTFPSPLPYTIKVDPETGYADLSDCLKRNFIQYYLSNAVAYATQALFDNRQGMGDQYAKLFQKYAHLFKGKKILGYELFNEPFYGDIYARPDLLLPGVADRKNLAPFYRMLYKAIRQVDNDTLVFFEPVPSDNFGSGFNEGPGGHADNDKQVYSYHIYCGLKSRRGEPTDLTLCEAIDDFFIYERLKDLKRVKTGGFCTEFGAVSALPKGIAAIEFIMGRLDDNLQSYAYWQYKGYNDVTTDGSGEGFYGDDGKLEVNKVKALSRTYARAIGGVPKKMSFDPKSGVFNFHYIPFCHSTLETEVYFNREFYYPNGYHLNVFPEDGVHVKESGNVLLFTTSGNYTCNEDVRITLAPKQ